MKPLHHKFLDKAKAAMIAAVEIYNKPLFMYREETFASLALNAWELLLKAKLLRDHSNDPKIIRVYERRKTKFGTPSKKQYLKRNRAGNPQTISIGVCVTRLEQAVKIDDGIKLNLNALIAVRDNAIHYITASPVLAKQVLEIASASVKNFVLIAKQWFGCDFSDSLPLMLPLSFISGTKEVESVVVTADESRLIKHLQQLANAPGLQSASGFAVAVRVDVKLERSSLTTASKVEISKDPDAVKIMLSEEDIRKKYSWDYRKLIIHLIARYVDFKQNARFHSIRNALLKDEKYVKARYLDPYNPKSAKKDFYNPNIIQIFDEHYTKKL